MSYGPLLKDVLPQEQLQKGTPSSHFDIDASGGSAIVLAIRVASFKRQGAQTPIQVRVGESLDGTNYSPLTTRTGTGVLTAPGVYVVRVALNAPFARVALTAPDFGCTVSADARVA